MVADHPKEDVFNASSFMQWLLVHWRIKEIG
jgi:hypothetical protein